jgi:hypothetical protein
MDEPIPQVVLDAYRREIERLKELLHLAEGEKKDEIQEAISDLEEEIALASLGSL